MQINSLGTSDGIITAKESNLCVSSDLLSEVWKWKEDGVCADDIISRLRCRTVPSGYAIHNWKDGKLIAYV